MAAELNSPRIDCVTEEVGEDRRNHPVPPRLQMRLFTESGQVRNVMLTESDVLGLIEQCAAALRKLRRIEGH